MMQVKSLAGAIPAQEPAAKILRRNSLIGLIAFLTVVDLFATQAILPSLARNYGVSSATMAVAVNASTFGMAFAGLGVTLFAHRIDRRRGVMLSLLLLSAPTALLATMPSLGVFATLRVLQGVFMAAAFTLTLAYLGEQCSAKAASGAFAAYITGNVASNLIGRLLSAAAADHFGLGFNFALFALLNMSGALLVSITLNRSVLPATMGTSRHSALTVWAQHLANPVLRAAFGIGFCILFAFLGTFSFVNFVLVRPPLLVGPMTLGLVYLVFLPSIFTTPLAGRVVERVGVQLALLGGLLLAGAGLPLLVPRSLPVILAGLVLMGVGTFLGQAVATGVVGRAADGDRASASGMYLFAYYAGGLTGTALLGIVFDRFGWNACVLGIGMALAGAALLGLRLEARPGLVGARA
ncbi:MAG: MFS transporter [Acetobacteraceae bacterium]|nr:MFS transporter [Acetobacteraceae bacterium]MBV8526496.1 MFS transporter [Acetobacteraceae bacterium]